MNGALPQTAALLLLFALAASISITDWRTMRIPDWATASLGICGLTFSTFLQMPNFIDAVAGGVLGGLFAGIVRSLYFWAKGIHGLGLGDVKFVAAAGCWTGTAGLMPMLSIASASALSYCAVLTLVGGRIALTTRLPFGPFLCLGLSIVAGIQIAFQSTMPDLLVGIVF